MKQFNRHLKCPWCGKGEALADAKAKVTISVQCGKCTVIDSHIDSGEITKMIDITAALLKPYIEKDPTKFYAKDTFEPGIAALKQYMALRSQKIKYELRGSDQTVDTTDFNMV